MPRSVVGLLLALVLAVGLALGWLAAGPGLSGGIAGPFSFAPIVERLNPAVVHVDVIDVSDKDVHEGVTKAPPLRAPQRGEGAGFVIDAAGSIVTNHHLVAHARRIRVRFSDGQEAEARLVGSDASTDVALLRIKRTGLPTVPLGDSDRLRIGDWVCAIGNPLSFDNSVTVGVVSSKGRKIFNASFDAYIQTDAAINPGNSGGPLINAAGEAVGISSAVSSEGQGIGFAIPINLAREVVAELERHGRVSRGYLGVQVHDLVPGLGRLVQHAGNEGAVVVDVIPGRATAGLLRYDVVAAVDGQRIANGDGMIRRIAALGPGARVELQVLRAGKPITLTAILGERGPDADPEDDTEEPPEGGAAPVTQKPRPKGDALGLVVEAQSRATKRGVPSPHPGVTVAEVVGLDPGTDVVEEGDVVLEVNREETPTLDAYRKALAALPRGERAWVLLTRPGVEGGAYLVGIVPEGEE